MVVVSAMNGLSVAGMAIGATIALPELLRRGYDKIMVTGVIQAGSSLGILVPPSVVLVLYGMIARQPVGQLWLAGAIPGLMMAGLFIIYIAGAVLDPARDRSGAPEGGAHGLVRREAQAPPGGDLAVPHLLLHDGALLHGLHEPRRELGGRRGGRDPPALLRRRLTYKVLEATVRKTLGVSCMFMWIILAALCFGAVFDGLGAVRAIEGFFLDRLGLGPWEVLILMQLSFLLMGTFLDDTAMLVIVAPLYVPLVKVLGFDLIWYGVLYTITCQIAYMTPPFGYNLFLMRAMAPPEIELMDIYRSIIPFVLVMVIALALVMVFPQLALWLPEQHYGR